MAQLLADVLPRSICNGLLHLIKFQARSENHFEDNYVVIDSTDQQPRSGAFGNIVKVQSIATAKEYAIKKVVIKDARSPIFKVFQESCLLQTMNGHANLIRNYPKLNWIVLPERLDSVEVIEVLEKGCQIDVCYLKNFLGKHF